MDVDPSIYPSAEAEYAYDESGYIVYGSPEYAEYEPGNNEEEEEEVDPAGFDFWQPEGWTWEVGGGGGGGVSGDVVVGAEEAAATGGVVGRELQEQEEAAALSRKRVEEWMNREDGLEGAGVRGGRGGRRGRGAARGVGRRGNTGLSVNRGPAGSEENMPPTANGLAKGDKDDGEMMDVGDRKMKRLEEEEREVENTGEEEEEDKERSRKWTKMGMLGKAEMDMISIASGDRKKSRMSSKSKKKNSKEVPVCFSVSMIAYVCL